MRRSVLGLILLLIPAPAFPQAIVNLSPVAKQQFLGADAKPLNGGKLYTYLAGTTTPTPTYVDSTGTSTNPNPVILDAGGFASIWLSVSLKYKFILYSKQGVLQWSQDNISAAGSGGGGGGGIAALNMTMDGVIYNTFVGGSPVTPPGGTLTPTRRSINSGLFLAGPPYPNGASNIVQTAYTSSPTVPSTLGVTFNNPTTQGNQIIVAFSCSAANAGCPSSAPAISDSQGNAFTLAGGTGPMYQWVALTTAGGADTITFAGISNSVIYKVAAFEVTNVTAVDVGNSGGISCAAGPYSVVLTTANNNELLIGQSVSSIGQPVIIGGLNTDASFISGSGSGAVIGDGNAATAGVQTLRFYGVDGSCGVNTGNNRALVFAYSTSGLPPANALSNFRYIRSDDLPASVVANNQSNKWYTGTQDFVAVAHLLVPAQAGLFGTADGEVAFNTTNGSYAGFANHVRSTFMSYADATTWTSGDCASASVTGGNVLFVPTGCSGGGVGGVSIFSAGNFTPLFTTSVATATTTPALSFAPVIQSANLVYASPDGTSGNPLFRAIVPADFPSLYPNAGTPFCYASYYGNDGSNGLSWATAKATVMGCYDALPTTGGSIFFTDGGSASNPIPLAKATDPTGTGIWLAGTSSSPDPNYAAISGTGLNVTDVAAAVGTTTVYTVTSAPLTLTATSPKITFSGSGLNSNNAGTFTCTTNTLTTITCTNSNGVLQSGLTGISAKLAGWRARKGTVSFIGMAGSCSAAFSQTPQVCITGGGLFSTADNNHPTIWLSDVFSHTFMNFQGGFPSRYLLLGIGSDNATNPTNPPASWDNKFVNIGFRSASATVAGTSYGPAVVIGSQSDWNSFDYDQFSTNATDAVTLSNCTRASNVTTCTISTGSWPSGWTGTMNLSVAGNTNDAFNGMHLAATIATSSTITYNDNGPGLSGTGGKISSDAAQAMVVNPSALAARGSGIMNIEHAFMNGGGIRYYAGNQGAQVNMYDLFQESGYAPPAHIVGCNQIASEQQIKIDTVFVADNVVTPLAGARYDNGNTPCARGVSAWNTTTAGPFTLGPGAGPTSSTILPSAQGASGVYANRIFAQEDTSRRAFTPAALPNGQVPLTLRAPSAWGTHLGGCGTPNIAGSSYASPDGLASAAALVAPSSGALQYACMYSASQTIAVGDYVVIGTWARSVNSNGYQNATTIQAACLTCIWARSGTHLVSAVPSAGGGGEWQWVSTWDKAAVGASDTLGIQGYSSSTNQVAYYGMTALYIPASAGFNDNEIADIALHLSPLNQTMAAGDVALLPLQRLRADSALIPVVSGFNYFTTADSSYAQDDTAALQSQFNACTTPGCTIYLPPGQYKATTLLSITGAGFHLIGAGSAGGGPGSGGPQLATTSIGCFSAHTGLLQLGTQSTANYGGGSIENIAFVDKTGSNNCGGAINAINQSYVHFKNVSFQGFTEAKTNAPALPSVTPVTSGGSFADGTYYAAIEDTDALGRETLPSTISSAITISGGSGAGSISFATHTAASPMTCYNIFVGTSNSISALHLVSQCHANGTAVVTAPNTSGIAPVNMDHSSAYGLNNWGTSGSLGSLAQGFSNQIVIDNVQVVNGGARNGIVMDRSVSGAVINSGNINGGSLTSGYGMILGGSAKVKYIHTEAGGTGWIRAGLTGATGELNMSMDLGSGTQTGAQLTNAWNWENITVSCGAGGTQTAIVADSTSNGNRLVAVDNTTCANPLISDSASFQAFKYDGETKIAKFSNILDGPVNTAVTTTTTISLADGYAKTVSYNQDATAADAITYTLPTAAKGLIKCVSNSDSAGTPDTGTLQVNTSASGQYIHTSGGRSASGGYIISGGAAGDQGCFVGVSTTDWMFSSQSGTWTLH